MRMPSAGRASPRKSSSTPAMIRRSVDLPAPLAPRTPILAPGKKASEMPRRISRLGGATLRRSRVVKMYWGAIDPAMIHEAAGRGRAAGAGSIEPEARLPVPHRVAQDAVELRCSHRARRPREEPRLLEGPLDEGRHVRLGVADTPEPVRDPDVPHEGDQRRRQRLTA